MSTCLKNASLMKKKRLSSHGIANNCYYKYSRFQKPLKKIKSTQYYVKIKTILVLN